MLSIEPRARVAAPIIRRALKNDGFFAFPVAAGGLQYDAVGPALGPKIRLASLPGWNIHRVNADPIRVLEAHAIADRVLDQCLTAIHRDEPAGPLRILVGTRAPLLAAAGEALTLDLTHRGRQRAMSNSPVWLPYPRP